MDTIEAILIVLADQGILADVCFHAGMPPVQRQRLTLKQVALLRKPKEVRAEVLAEHLIANVEAAFGSPLKFENSDDTAIGYFQDFDVGALSDSDVVRLLGPIVESQGAEIANVQAKATGDVLPYEDRGVYGQGGRVLFGP